MNENTFNLKQFVVITLITSIWIHISEILRYFMVVMPSVKTFFYNKEDVALIDWNIFTIWTFWDTLLTAILVFVFWLYARSFECTAKSAIVSGTVVWCAVFVIFWVATANMGLAKWQTVFIVLPLCWVEMIIGALIAYKLYKK